MKLTLDLNEESADLLARQIAKHLYPKGANSEQSSPVNDLNNWIRAEDLYSKNLFSKATLNKYYKQGLIGKSTIGGLVCYKISDITGLLEAAHIKKESAEGIGKDLRDRKA